MNPYTSNSERLIRSSKVVRDGCPLYKGAREISICTPMVCVKRREAPARTFDSYPCTSSLQKIFRRSVGIMLPIRLSRVRTGVFSTPTYWDPGAPVTCAGNMGRIDELTEFPDI